jgi:hypothetical protein
MLFDVPAFSTATYFEASTALPAVVGTTAAIYTRFSSAMTDAGGAIPILLSFDSYEGVCQAVDCTVFTPPLDAVAAGEISAPTSIAPEPEPWATLVLGLIGLAALKLRHRSTRG